MSNNILGSYLKTLRKQHNYSQEFVASHLNVIRQTYSHYETGRNTPPTDMLFQLSDLYQVPVDNLIELSMCAKGQLNALPHYHKRINAADSTRTASTVPFHALTTEELELLTHFRTLDDVNREEVIDIVKLKCKRYTRKNNRN